MEKKYNIVLILNRLIGYSESICKATATKLFKSYVVTEKELLAVAETMKNKGKYGNGWNILSKELNAGNKTFIEKYSVELAGEVKKEEKKIEIIEGIEDESTSLYAKNINPKVRTELYNIFIKIAERKDSIEIVNELKNLVNKIIEKGE